MTRRAALATAGAITIVLLAAAAAIAANLGLLRVATDTGPTGDASGAQAREPSNDSSADVRSGVEPGDDHRSPGSQLQDEPYGGRGDDD